MDEYAKKYAALTESLANTNGYKFYLIIFSLYFWDSPSHKTFVNFLGKLSKNLILILFSSFDNVKEQMTKMNGTLIKVQADAKKWREQAEDANKYFFKFKKKFI